MPRTPDRFVLYRSKVYKVTMVYSHHLELTDGQQTINVKFGDPELDRQPSEDDLRAALRRLKRR